MLYNLLSVMNKLGDPDLGEDDKKVGVVFYSTSLNRLKIFRDRNELGGEDPHEGVAVDEANLRMEVLHDVMGEITDDELRLVNIDDDPPPEPLDVNYFLNLAG